PLPEKEALRLGSQLAEGLAAAHEQNVVHRDLKPANLRVTPDGRLKILDFGLAKLFRPARDDAVTAEGLSHSQLGIAGTVPYMSPEQLRGETVDARTDIYAAGCVLYEMVTRRRPFQETLSTALTDAILHKPAPPPGRLQPDLSSDLERIILKCLEKDPENRYQSAKELLVDLRRLAAPTAVPIAPSPVAPATGRIATLLRSAQRPLPLGIGAMLVVIAVALGFNVAGLRDRLFGTPAPQIESLAVLPLENLSRDPEQDYFADGMTEALIAEMSKISALKVISRTSAMQYKGVKKPMPQIARELGVDALIEGSVVREGDQVRITVQLIHGPTDRHLWAESYQRELRGILALQSEVARAIAAQVHTQLTPQEQTQLAGSRSVNPDVYELYLKARFHSSQ
ncbi:MAG: serine/threonine protein kinase, partial [Candidatus Acidiferrales bacterium]